RADPVGARHLAAVHQAIQGGAEDAGRGREVPDPDRGEEDDRAVPALLSDRDRVRAHGRPEGHEEGAGRGASDPQGDAGPSSPEAPPSYPLLLDVALAVLIGFMTQKLSLSDISEESKDYLDKSGIATACLRIKSKWTAGGK